MFRQELKHQHGNLVAKQGLDASLKPQSHGHWQNVTGTGTSQPLMQPVEFQHRYRSVVLGLAQNPAMLLRVGAHTLGFFGGKFFNAVVQSGWRRPMPRPD